MTDEDRIALGIAEGKVALLSRIIAESEKANVKPLSTRHFLKVIDAHLHVDTNKDGDELHVDMRVSGNYPSDVLNSWATEIAKAAA